MGTWGLEIYGDATVARFARRHLAARRPLQRFLELARQARWPHFEAVKRTFPATDYVARRLIFDIGGNKYRLIATVDFEAQMSVVDSLMTHGEYDKEEF